MKTLSPYNFLLAAIVVILASCQAKDSLPSFRETFSKSDKNPFGSYVAFRQLNELFYRNDIRVKKVSLDKVLNLDYGDSSSLFISISKNFYLKRTELEALLDYADKGNNVFISASHFDSSLLKETHLSANTGDPLLGMSFLQMKNTGVHLSSPYFTGNAVYSYYYLPLQNSFTVPTDDDANVKVLGTNENGQPDFVVAFYGKGRLYLHCEPRVFGNYFLLQKDNYKYLQHAFSFMPKIPGNIFWDDFYNKRNEQPSAKSKDDDGKSGFSVLLKYPAMAWAFWLILLLMALYLLFGSKRKQRIITPIPPNKNTSAAFTETVARLYLQKKDNRNIAEKLITYFLEHVRNQYFLNTNNLNEDFISMLSRKSNVPLDNTEHLIGTIRSIQRYDEVDDALLLSLNKQIENFYKHK